MFPVWAVLTAPLQQARADTLTVCASGCDYPTIVGAVGAATNGDHIQVHAGTYSGTIEIYGIDLTIEAVDGPARTIIDGTTAIGAGLVVVFGSPTVTLRGLWLRDTTATPCLYAASSSHLIVEGSTFSRCSATSGGAIFIPSPDASLTLTDSTVEDCEATANGGAIASAAPVQIVDSVFARNTSPQGGALDLTSSGASSVSGSYFIRNVVTQDGPGGALAVVGGALTIEDTLFADNTTTWFGGAIHAVDLSTLHIERTHFDASSVPSAARQAGAMWIEGTTAVTIAKSAFTNIVTDNNGGAIRATVDSGSSFTVETSRFCSIDGAIGAGGALHIGGAPAVIRNTIFQDNLAETGGGVYAATIPAGFTLLNNTFVGGTAQDGGAVSASDTPLGLFSNNLVAWALVDGADGLAPVVNTYNAWYDNGPPHTSGTFGLGYQALVDIDPLLVSYVPGDCGSDLRPQPTSPLIDAGDPVLLDPDGSRSDIGAWGGPNAPIDDDNDGYDELTGDCDDDDPLRYPGAFEVIADGVDQDCDRSETCYVDADADGYVSTALLVSIDDDCTDIGEGSLALGFDCDDTDFAIGLIEVEVPADGLDQDCDGTDTCFEDGDHDGQGSLVVIVGSDLFCTGDGESLVSTDCNDTDASVFVGALEVCNTVDDNCDSLVDEGTPDSDGDDACDEVDPCPMDAPDDTDGDGVCNSVDVCPLFDDALDVDLDFIPDGCDACVGDNDQPDTDGDGICEDIDLCLGDDATLDADGDGVCADLDPCPLDSPDDTDDDGVCDSADACPLSDDRLDADLDSVPDGCDTCTGDDAQSDSDGDGICEDIDLCLGDDAALDTDGDGTCDDLDPSPLGEGGPGTPDSDDEGKNPGRWVPRSCGCSLGGGVRAPWLLALLPLLRRRR